MLVTTVSFVVILLVVAAVGVGMLVAPFVTALQMAESRRFATGRWGALALAGSLGGLLLTWLLWHRPGLPKVVALIPLVLTWLGPTALWVLEEGQSIGGRPGRHE